jgi:hypothetical protein
MRVITTTINSFTLVNSDDSITNRIAEKHFNVLAKGGCKRPTVELICRLCDSVEQEPFQPLPVPRVQEEKKKSDGEINKSIHQPLQRSKKINSSVSHVLSGVQCFWSISPKTPQKNRGGMRPHVSVMSVSKSSCTSLLHFIYWFAVLWALGFKIKSFTKELKKKCVRPCGYFQDFLLQEVQMKLHDRPRMSIFPFPTMGLAFLEQSETPQKNPLFESNNFVQTEKAIIQVFFVHACAHF